MGRNKPQREHESTSDPSPYLTQDEAARIAHVVRKTIGRWREEELFLSTRPVGRGSGRVLIDRASFLAFLAGEAVGA